MGHKFAHFYYLVKCSNMLFERILVHLAVSPQTSESTLGLVLSPADCWISFFVHTPQCQIRVKPRHARCTFHIAYSWPCAYPTRVIHNVSQRRQRKEVWAMVTVIGNMQLKLGEVWTCGYSDKHANRQTHMNTDIIQFTQVYCDTKE